jgi:adenine-specific DNA methylase
VLVTLIRQIRRANGEMVADGMPENRARALATYSGMAFGRLVNSFTRFCRWQGQE